MGHVPYIPWLGVAVSSLPCNLPVVWTTGCCCCCELGPPPVTRSAAVGGGDLREGLIRGSEGIVSWCLVAKTATGGDVGWLDCVSWSCAVSLPVPPFTMLSLPRVVLTDTGALLTPSRLSTGFEMEGGAASLGAEGLVVLVGGTPVVGLVNGLIVGRGAATAQSTGGLVESLPAGRVEAALTTPTIDDGPGCEEISEGSSAGFSSNLTDAGCLFASFLALPTSREAVWPVKVPVPSGAYTEVLLVGPDLLV